MIAAVWQILLQLAPWILLGTLIAGLIHVLLPKGFIHRRLQGASGVLKAVGIGVPLPLCSCGVIPAGIGLKKDGASDGAAVGFLISTPQTGVDSILVSASFLGWPFALFKVVAAAVTGILGGLLVDRGQTARPTEAPPEIDPGSPPQGSRVRALIDHGLEIIRSIWRWLVVGILASAAITTYVPADGLSGVGSMGIVVSCLAALAISLPLYVCATASVPIAYALVHSGLPSGAALVFLMAGPATNVATMGAIYRSFGKRVLAIYLGTIIAGSGIAAILFEGFFDVQLSDQADAPHMHAAWWSVASACVLLALLAWFALEDLRRWWTNRTAGAPDAADAELTVPVQGMSCMNCVNRLEQALRKIEGVDSAVVHLDPGEAIVRGEIDEAYVRAVIRETGFQPQSEQTAG